MKFEGKLQRDKGIRNGEFSPIVGGEYSERKVGENRAVFLVLQDDFDHLYLVSHEDFCKIHAIRLGTGLCILSIPDKTV